MTILQHLFSLDVTNMTTSCWLLCILHLLVISQPVDSTYIRGSQIKLLNGPTRAHYGYGPGMGINYVHGYNMGPLYRMCPCKFSYRPIWACWQGCRGKYICHSSNKCIDRSLICNGITNCPGYDDELNCPCPPLSNPVNGHVDLTEGTMVNNKARFSCNTGYNLIGQPFRTCRSNAVWDGVSPTCQTEGCDCGMQQAVYNIPMPVNGGGDVLTRQQFRDIVVPLSGVGVYTIISVNSTIAEGHLYELIQSYSGSKDNFKLKFKWNEIRGRTNIPCTQFEGDAIQLNDQWAVQILRDSDSGRDISIDIYLSSCPSEYLWIFVCNDLSSLHTGYCPNQSSLFILMVPESVNNVSLDELPWASIERDLYKHTHNTINFCKRSNMLSRFILGDHCVNDEVAGK